MTRPAESPLPTSERDASLEPDVELASLDEIERHLPPAAFRRRETTGTTTPPGDPG